MGPPGVTQDPQLGAEVVSDIASMPGAWFALVCVGFGWFALVWAWFALVCVGLCVVCGWFNRMWLVYGWFSRMWLVYL